MFHVWYMYRTSIMLLLSNQLARPINQTVYAFSVNRLDTQSCLGQIYRQMSHLICVLCIQQVGVVSVYIKIFCLFDILTY